MQQKTQTQIKKFTEGVLVGSCIQKERRQDLFEEIYSHIEISITEKQLQGLSEEQALNIALSEFGTSSEIRNQFLFARLKQSLSSSQTNLLPSFVKEINWKKNISLQSALFFFYFWTFLIGFLELYLMTDLYEYERNIIFMGMSAVSVTAMLNFIFYLFRAFRKRKIIE